MRKKIVFYSSILFIVLFALIVRAETHFVVKSIEINGLQGISKKTVMSYLPLKPGDSLSVKKSNAIIDSLYQTGFFDDVRLERNGDKLIINVKQRPIISRIKIEGNKQLPTDKLNEAIRRLGFTEGSVFNPSILDKIKGSLIAEYFTLGRYNATVDVKVIPEERNRVQIVINISEGIISKIRQIMIIGNRSFSTKTLLHQMKLTTPGLLTWYTHADQYSKEKLAADLEMLRSFYMDRGYLKFKIDSSQVSITPDKKAVYIIINLTEGGLYTISGYTFEGQLILPKAALEKYVAIKKGEVFSRKTVIGISEQIAKALGNKGYANADVQAVPNIHEDDHTVFLTFKVTPGPRIYIHHIIFDENYRTNDEALRRELLVTEGGVLSTADIEESKRRLMMLPFVKNVEVTKTAVAGKPNQVNLHYKVTEIPSTEFRAGVGFSLLEKFTLNAGITQKNLLGTGNSLNFSALYSKPSAEASLNYYNPYYTDSGIGRSISLYGTHFNADKANITDYATSDYGLNVGYNMPVGRYTSMQFGYGYENNLITLGNSPSQQLSSFTNEYGRHFYQLKVNAGLGYQSFDRYLFPTMGWMHSVAASSSVPFSGHSLRYYRITYGTTGYYPFYRSSWIGQLKGNIGYGNGYGKYGGDMPFFKNFFLGGMGSVRGFEGNSIGPHDSKDEVLGGNFEMNGTLGLVFPNPFGDSVRTIWFADAGSVYKTDSDKKRYGINFGELRYSTGLEVDWQSPIGILNFSLAAPLHKRDGDKTQLFDFNVGASL